MPIVLSPSLKKLKHALIVVCVYCLVCSHFAASAEIPQTNPESIELKIFLDSRITEAGWANSIDECVQTALRHLREQVGISLTKSEIQNLEISPDLIGVLDKELERKHIEFIRQKIEAPEAMALAFIGSHGGGGRACEGERTAICYVDTDPAFLTPELVLHELAHLFGAFDVEDDTNIMNWYLPAQNNKLEFDKITVALMKLTYEQYQLRMNVKDFEAPVVREYAKKKAKLLHSLVSKAHYKVQIYRVVGLAYTQSGNYQEALDAFRKELAFTTETAEPYDGDYGISTPVREFQILNKITGHPSMHSASPRVRIGICLNLLERYKDAKDVLEEELREGNETPALRFELGRAYLHLAGRAESAIQCFQRCVESDPTMEPAWCNLGIAYLGTVETTNWNCEGADLAIDALKKAIDLKADFAMAHHVLGLILNARGDKEQGLYHINRGIHLGSGPTVSIVMRDGIATFQSIE